MSEKVLEIENVTVNFDGFKALNQLNFSMDPGELRVVIGPNGAGKTTFLDAITGKVQPTSGVVRFKGRDLRSLSEHQISRLGIGRKFQTPRVYQNLTVRDNLELSSFPKKNVFSSLFAPTTRTQQRSIAGLLETIGLTPKADMQAALLSHGEKQRLEIGMLVAQSPDLLLVDEPAAGLTDEETENLGNLLIALAESHSLIVIEHDMEFVRQIARKVTVLHEGSVLFEGSMQQVQIDPRVIEVYLGETPSLSAQEMAILRVAAAIAWADGTISPEEQDAILTRLSRHFATDSQQEAELRSELRDYLAQEMAIADLVPLLGEDLRDRQLALSLAYEVLYTHQISITEAAAYQELLNLLDLPLETVAQIEADVRAKGG
jgi:urea transport system ATP-binding protein